VIFLAIGLQRDPREIPSPLVGKPAPEFKLFTLADNEQQFGPQDMRGQVWMLNVWATWCVACREEHPLLVQFSKDNKLPIVGLSYKEVQPQDEPPGAKMTPEAKRDLARQRSENGCVRVAIPMWSPCWIWMAGSVLTTVCMAFLKPMSSINKG